MLRPDGTPRPEAGLALSTSGIACSIPAFHFVPPRMLARGDTCSLAAVLATGPSSPYLSLDTSLAQTQIQPASLPFHDIPAALDLGDGMSPEPIKPATGRRTVCDHCRRRRTSDPNQTPIPSFSLISTTVPYPYRQVELPARHLQTLSTDQWL
jgi:hypothetical protein